MANWKNILLGTGIGAGIIAGLAYLMNLKRMGTELETVSTLKVHQIDLSGITLRADAILKNPTKTALSIKFPFLRLLHKGEVIGSSEVVDKDITIPAFGQAVVERIMISIPLIGAFSVAGDLIQSIRNKQAVKLLVKITTIIDLGIKQLPYESNNEVILNTNNYAG